MEVNRQTSSVTTTGSPEQVGQGGNLSQELVRQVAEKVYTLLLEDLRIERERRRYEMTGGNEAQGGGCYGHID